ncbi:MAG: Ku protein [Archangiaceae bacterium]|nr:Ku protein [Archangiaceae bacterium]
MWKGAISFGLVSIPVSLGVAIRPKDVHFHQVHDKDGGRIRQKRVCELDGKEVPYQHIAKGYEVSKGKVVVIPRDELKALDPVSDKTISVEAVVDPGEIDPLYFDSTYWVMPDAKTGAGAKAYTLFATALEKMGRVAIARVVISTKQHLCCLRERDGQLVLTTMVYPDEVAKAPSVPRGSPGAKELELARSLMQSLAGHFKPDDYRDEHRARVEKLLVKKAEGKTIETPEGKEEAPKMDNLLEALQQSLSGHGAGKGRGHAKPHRAARRAPKRRTRKKSA